LRRSVEIAVHTGSLRQFYELLFWVVLGSTPGANIINH
jgi:hypothetical protein